MNAPNGVHNRIRRALEPLVGERDTIADELTALEEQVAAKKAEKKLVEKLLRDAGLIEPPDKANGNGKKPERRYYVSAEMLDRAREFLPDGEFTVKDAAEAMEVAELTAKKAVEHLRGTKEVRLVGKRVPAGSKSATKAAHYARVG